MRASAKELNYTFEQLPEIEVDDFRIYRDGRIDRRAMFELKARQLVVSLGKAAHAGVIAAVDVADMWLEAAHQQFDE